MIFNNNHAQKQTLGGVRFRMDLTGFGFIFKNSRIIYMVKI